MTFSHDYQPGSDTTDRGASRLVWMYSTTRVQSVVDSSAAEKAGMKKGMNVYVAPITSAICRLSRLTLMKVRPCAYL